MDVKFNIPLKRSTNGICFFGNMSSGKTFAMVYYAFKLWLDGYTIYSNVHLEFPYVPVVSLDDLSNIRDGVFLGDDFEKWASSKFITNRDKSDLLEATLQFGKRKVSPFLWSCKRPLEVDKTFRYVTNWYVACRLLLKYMPRTYSEYEYMSGFLDAHVIEMQVYDSLTLGLDRVSYLDDLDLYCNLYDTSQEISHLSRVGVEGLAKGNDASQLVEPHLNRLRRLRTGKSNP